MKKSKILFIVIIIFVILTVICIGFSIYFNKKFNDNINSNDINNTTVEHKNEKLNLEKEGLLYVDGVYTFNIKEEDLYQKLKNDYNTLYADNFSVYLEKKDEWYSLTLESSKEYIGNNIYIMESSVKLFKPILTHNGYIKEIELAYNLTSENTPTDTTYILMKDFAELSGVSLEEIKNKPEYFECKQEIVGSIISSNFHWKYHEFALAVQYAKPGSPIYNLPHETKTSDNGVSFVIKTTNKYDEKECNNKATENQQENNETDLSSGEQSLLNNNTNLEEDSSNQSGSASNAKENSNNQSSTLNNNYNNSDSTNNQAQENDVEMPNLIGLSLTEASNKLNSLGIKYQVQSVATLTKPETIISQSIPVGTKKSNIYTSVVIKVYKKVSSNVTVEVKLVGNTEESKALYNESNHSGVKGKVIFNGQESNKTLYHGGEKFYFDNVTSSTATIQVYIKDKLMTTKTVNLEDIMVEKNNKYYASVTIEI